MVRALKSSLQTSLPLGKACPFTSEIFPQCLSCCTELLSSHSAAKKETKKFASICHSRNVSHDDMVEPGFSVESLDWFLGGKARRFLL